MKSNEILQSLVDMSHYVGEPGRGYAILGEGNSSARIDADSMYIKASGTSLGIMKPSDFLAVSISKVTGILDDPGATDDDVRENLRAALLDSTETRLPSVETVLHALLYEYPEYNFIAHTHPVACNGLLCSVNAKEAMLGRLCPDHIVVMGRASVYVPYVDPGAYGKICNEYHGHGGKNGVRVVGKLQCRWAEIHAAKRHRPHCHTSRRSLSSKGNWIIYALRAILLERDF